MDSISQYIKVEEDVLFQRGIEKGIERGIEKSKQDFIVNLLRDGYYSLEKIASIVGVSLEIVKSIKEQNPK